MALGIIHRQFQGLAAQQRLMTIATVGRISQPGGRRAIDAVTVRAHQVQGSGERMAVSVREKKIAHR